jgi:hypothetical protein
MNNINNKNKGIGSSITLAAVLAILTTTTMAVQMANAITDPSHCDVEGLPSCYRVGYNHGFFWLSS